MTYSEQTLDVDAIEICLDLSNSTACCQGLHKRDQRARNRSIEQADEKIGCIGRPETPCRPIATSCFLWCKSLVASYCFGAGFLQQDREGKQQGAGLRKRVEL